jgi:carboxylesterase type B
MRSGFIKRMPMIIGFNSFESLVLGQLEIDAQPKIFQIFDSNPSHYVPFTLNISGNPREEAKVVSAFKSQYFMGHSPNYLLRNQWFQYLTDRIFTFSIDRTVQAIADLNDSPPIYYYRFSYDGTFNWGKRLLSVNLFPGAGHVDDLFYMFQVQGMKYS